jgi:CheY-like chemotaxis protein
VQAFARLRGFRVIAASDAAAALACLRSESFDLAVCDLDAPGLRTSTFLPSVRSERPLLAKKLLFLNLSPDESPPSQGPSLMRPFELDRMEEAAAGVLNKGKTVTGAAVLQS